MISCKCTTYGRVALLEEALHSFLQQKYDGDKELIIVNDYPLQKLIFSHPEVKIFNLEKTFKTIGEKENFTLEQCKGEIIAVWDDDDIALPNHLSNINKYFVEGTNMLHWGKGVYYNAPNITTITTIGNSGMVYSREIWERLKHPLENAGGDMTFVNCVHKIDKTKIVIATPPNEEVSWFYRWGGIDVYHQSGQGYDVAGKPDIIQRHSVHINIKRRRGEIPIGDIYLAPVWKYDYSKMLKDFILK